MKITDSYWLSQDKLRIFCREWRPESEPEGIICLVHGLGEHCSRYEHVAEYFANKGYAILAYDRRGHGRSEGKRGHTASYDLLLDEVGQLIEEGKKRFPGKPMFLYGHSMGGNLVLNYLLRRKPPVNGVIATGSHIKLSFEPAPYLIFLGKLTRKLIPSFTQSSGLDPKDFSHDPEVVQAFQNDPLTHDKISSELGLSLIDSASWLLENAGETKIPLLIMHGGEDNITSPEGSKEFFAKSSGDVELKIWDGMYHEIHNEPGKEEVLNHIWNWIQSRT